MTKGHSKTAACKSLRHPVWVSADPGREPPDTEHPVFFLFLSFLLPGELMPANAEN